MSLHRRYPSICEEELHRRLAHGEPIVLLDVRTDTEFSARHIPGSLLVPLHELESRWEEIPNSGTPVTVICEYGVRSASACQFLAERGIGPLMNVTGGLAAWKGPVAQGMTRNGQIHPIAPSRFLVENFDLLLKGLALDLAMGEGRNAIYLATRGFDVDGVDVNADRVARARAQDYGKQGVGMEATRIMPL